MRFYNFLKIIYKNKNDLITKQEDFVKKMFCSGGAKYSYSEDYSKKILNGSKPLATNIRELVTEDYNYDLLCHFFEVNIDDLRLIDIFTAFKIKTDMQMNKIVLCMALCAQFRSYMQNGDDVELQVSETYEILLDKLRFGDKPNINEDALFQSKMFIYNAVKSLKDLKAAEGVLNNKAPFEAFFSSIKSAHNSFINNARYDARQIYRAFCCGCYKPDNPKDSFLWEVSKQGNQQIDFVKQIKYIVYDNTTFHDQSPECTIDLFEDTEYNKIIDTLKSVDSKGKREIYFTEYIIFKLRGAKNNLLSDYMYILKKTLATFEYMEEHITPNVEIETIDKKIHEVFNNLNMEMMQYLTDGTFYPETGEIEYAPSIEPFLIGPDNEIIVPGEQLFPGPKGSSNVFIKPNESVEYNFKTMYLLAAQKMTRLGQIERMMFEIVTFNPDGKYRYYMFPATSKAKLYRKIRYIADRIRIEKTIGFFSIGVFVTSFQPIDAPEKLSKEREQEGITTLCGYGYANGHDFSAILTDDDIKQNNIKNIKHDYETDDFVPMIYEIQKNEKKKKQKK